MSEENNGAENGARMSFLDHLAELRGRLIHSVVAIGLGFAVCLAFGERVFQLLAGPITALLPKDTPLVFTALPDPFFMYLKVSLIAGVFLALPYIIYQLWLFVYPGLLPRERKLAFPFISVATLLFYTGAAFAYFLVFPAAFKFFLSYQTPDLKPMISIRDYVSLAMLLMLAFGAVFETPIIVVFLGLLGLFDSSFLKRGRRYFVVLAFIIAAILTPTPDMFNQTIMAVPMILFYEIGIQVLAIFEKKRAKEEAREAAEEDQPEPEQ
jgi:sec-independent protein translocase protein TatC